MLSTTATFGDIAPGVADAVWWSLLLGGSDVGSRTSIFDQIFLVFVTLGTLVGVVVIAYTLKNAYSYRDGNDTADEPKGRPQLGELPTGAAKGGRKLFLSFSISALIVVSLIAWTYGMLIVVDDVQAQNTEDSFEVDVEGYQFGWEFEYQDEERIPAETADQIAIAVENESADVDSGDVQQAADSGDVSALLESTRAAAEANEVTAGSESLRAGSVRPNLVQNARGMTDNREFNGDTFYLPANTRVFLSVTSQDVWHNFGINAFRVKSDAIPGETTKTWFETEEPTGENDYHIAECFELCGTGHSNMKAKVKVLSQDEYQDWYTNQTVAVEDLDEYVEQRREELTEESDDSESSGRLAGPTTPGVIGA